jgi:hypothetical protein
MGTKCTIFIDDLPRMLPTSSDSFGKAVSEKKIYLEINQSETRIACGGHVCEWIGTKSAIFIEDRP